MRDDEDVLLRFVDYEPPDLYLFIRTKLKMHHDAEHVARLTGNIPVPVHVLKFGGAHIWSNGVVLKTAIGGTPEEVATIFKNKLNNLDYWAIHDAEALVAEPHGGGAIGVALRKLEPKDAPVTQIFVRFRDGEPKIEELADQVKAMFREPVQSAFHFDDGRVYFLRTNQSARLLMNRFQNIRHQIRFAIAIGPEGELAGVCAGAGEPAWSRLSFIET